MTASHTVRTALINDLIEHVKEVAHDVASSEEHNIMAFIVPGAAAGLPDGAVLPVMPEAMPDENAKELFTQFLRATSKDLCADAVIVVMEAYISFLRTEDVARDDRDLHTQMRTSPTRQETLICSVERKLGATTFYYAPIGVDGGIGARRVGPFVEMPTGISTVESILTLKSTIAAAKGTQ